MLSCALTNSSIRQLRRNILIMWTSEIFAASSSIHHLPVSSLVYDQQCQSPRLSSVPMGYTDVSCMGSVRTLLTIQSKSLFQASSKAGAQGTLQVLPLLSLQLALLT